MNPLIRLVRQYTENVSYTVRWGIARGMKRKGGLQFIPQITKLRAEEIHLMGLDLTGKTVYDIGGFEGIFTLHFSRATGANGHVVTFEPNPINQKKIETNIALNSITNTRLMKVGLGSKLETLTLVVPVGERESGTVNNNAQQRYLGDPSHREVQVVVDSLDHLIAQESLPVPDFMKIDIEGFENEALKGASQLLSTRKPAMHIEIHTHVFDAMTDKRKYLDELLQILFGHGYSITCVETGEQVTASSTSLFEESHFYCV
jgi:FkbM family methyltransferase